jgi:hypothetical protein
MTIIRELVTGDTYYNGWTTRLHRENGHVYINTHFESGNMSGYWCLHDYTKEDAEEMIKLLTEGLKQLEEKGR